MSWKENLSSAKQKTLLVQRNSLVRRFGKEKKADLDSECWLSLKALSSEKLRPIIFHSDQHGWMGGFLLQRVGNGGYRILVMLEDWQIVRTKKSARVITVSETHAAQHTSLMWAQETYYGSMLELRDRCQSTSPKKASRSRSRKKRKGRSS